MRTVLRGGVPLLWIYSGMDRRGTVFLDSSMRNGLGRRSYIGMVPYRTHLPGGSGPMDILNGIDGETLMGYITYDQGMMDNGIGSKHPGPDIPLFALTDFDVILEEDHSNGSVSVTCMGRAMSVEDEMALVDRLVKCAVEPPVPEVPEILSVEQGGRDSFVDSVGKARELEADGEFYVINLSRRIHVRSDADPYDVFLRLRSISPSPFGAFMEIYGTTVISSSMELLLDAEGGTAWTRPIKGTSPRTGIMEEDRRSLGWLLASDKDRSELLMVTDMERNDMNRFCVPGTVTVESFFSPEEYSTLYHTVSDVMGRISEETGIGDMVGCMFPGGSVSGAPKRACLEYIDELEEESRGLYTGSIGMFSRERTVMNIAIRTMTHHDGVFTMGVGGGITFESDPGSEYLETVQKGKAMMRALGDGNGA